ncbi:hypothetical protein VTO73DRAFT_15454 [Trametes versicolor]
MEVDWEKSSCSASTTTSPSRCASLAPSSLTWNKLPLMTYYAYDRWSQTKAASMPLLPKVIGWDACRYGSSPVSFGFCDC